MNEFEIEDLLESIDEPEAPSWLPLERQLEILERIAFKLKFYESSNFLNKFKKNKELAQ